MVENRRLRVALLQAGHAPKTVLSYVIADDGAFLYTEESVIAECHATCPGCAKAAARSDVEHDGTVPSDAGVFTEKPAWNATEAGVRMGDGVGGRVPRYPGLDPLEAEDLLDDDYYDAVDRFGVLPRARVRATDELGNSFSAREEFLRIAKGDLSTIPAHSSIMCEFSYCREAGCPNNDGARPFRKAIVNRIYDLAERLKDRSPFAAGVAASRKMMQTGVTLSEFAEMAMSALNGELDISPPALSSIGFDPHMRIPTPLRSLPRVNPCCGPAWDAPGVEDLLPVEEHLDAYYVGIFR